MENISNQYQRQTMKNWILILVLSVMTVGYVNAQKSTLQKQGTATQLVVDGKPFLILGGELGNSSAACTEDIERIFPKLQRMGLNTVLVPAYWDLIEPQEGQFDFTLTDKVIRQARQNDLKVIFLWFGAWKNSMSCYAPLWFKENYKKYPRAYTQKGKPLEIASAFSENVFQADNRAFSQWMEHVAAIDKEEGTVIMIQIENEIGMLEDARDYSKEANALFVLRPLCWLPVPLIVKVQVLLGNRLPTVWLKYWRILALTPLRLLMLRVTSGTRIPTVSRTW